MATSKPKRPNLDDIVLRRIHSRVVNLVDRYILDVPNAPPTFDLEKHADIMEALLTSLSAHNNLSNLEEARTALVKIISFLVAHEALEDTDVQIYDRSLALRDEFYTNIMRARRAMLHYVEANKA